MTAQIITAIPVPFTSNGEVDTNEFDAALASISEHVHGILVAGTTGEFPALDDDERLDLFGRAISAFGLPRVIAHLGHGSARQVLRLAAGAAELGITRFALLSPYYLPTDDDGVVDFYRTLTEAHPEASVYAYLFPERTGMDVPPETLARIMTLPGMVGVKLSGAASEMLPAYLAVLQTGQELYSGNDATLPYIVAQGGTGIVSGVSSAFPRAFAALARAIDESSADLDDLQQNITQIVSLVGPTIPRLKAAMAARSVAPWASRMTMPVVEPDVRTAIVEMVAQND